MSASVSDSVQQQPSAPRKPQPWLTMPGAPPQPDFAGFRQQMNQMSEEKRGLIEQLKVLQGTARGDGSTNAANDARKEARDQMTRIENQRKVEKDLRAAKDEEIAALRKQRREASDKLRSLEGDLGGFKDTKEIDAAIAYLIQKMETSGGGLTSEKKTMKQVHQLEQAKALFVELQPLHDSIQQLNDREVTLQQEYREIHERIGVLNKEYEELHQSQREKDRESRENGVNRAEIYKQCDVLRAHVTELNGKMDTLRADHTAKSSAWDTWKVEAREKYFAKVQADREERHRLYLERKNASKNEEKRSRAVRRQNPYEQEINTCGALITYLQDKKHMTQREEEERARKAAAAAFDPASAAPSGCVVLSESKWAKDGHAGAVGKAAKKQKQSQAAKPKTSTATPTVSALQHPEEKRHQFMAVGVEPPLTLAAIDDKITELKARQKEYQSHITTGELALSSDDDEEEEAAEDADEAEADGDDHAPAEAETEEPAAVQSRAIAVEAPEAPHAEAEPAHVSDHDEL